MFIRPSNVLKALLVVAIVLPSTVFAWRWGEEFWYGRYPVEDGYAAHKVGDHSLAHPILRAYAKRGDPRAQTYVAIQYENGFGTFRSEWLAALWMQRAADRYYPDALVKMGDYYRQSVGVDSSLAAAIGYFQRADALGHPDGAAGLGLIDYERFGFDAGLPTLKRAADSGSGRAHALICTRAHRPWPHDTSPPLKERERLDHCVNGALLGEHSSMCAAIAILRDEESPVANLQRAYELAIIGSAWWPRHDPHECGRISDLAKSIVLGARPPRALGDAAAEAYRNARNIVEERIRILTTDPGIDLGIPTFGPDTVPLLEIDAMLRAETAAKDYLADNPSPPDWMM